MGFQLAQRLNATATGRLGPGRLDGSPDKGRDVVFDLISVEPAQASVAARR